MVPPFLFQEREESHRHEELHVVRPPFASQRLGWSRNDDIGVAMDIIDAINHTLERHAAASATTEIVPGLTIRRLINALWIVQGRLGGAP